MKKTLLTVLAALTLIGNVEKIPEVSGKGAVVQPALRPDTLCVIETAHRDDFSGYFIAERYTETLYREAGKTAYDIQFRIDEDPEDLLPGDLIAVIINDMGTSDISDDVIVDYRYIGTRF